jgi:hypothetical protein
LSQLVVQNICLKANLCVVFCAEKDGYILKAILWIDREILTINDFFRNYLCSLLFFPSQTRCVEQKKVLGQRSEIDRYGDTGVFKRYALI